MNAVHARLNPPIGPSCRSAGGRLVLAREAFWVRCPRPIALAARRIGFALLGDSLFSVAKKVSKNACPCIRVSLRSTSLIPSTLRGPAYKGHPWPFTPLAASMPLAPLRADSVRPPERGVRRRLMVRSRKNRKSVSSQQRCVYVPSRNENLVGWKTAKHFPPQSSPRSVSNFAFENRWVSFALPTLRLGPTSASLHRPSDATESPLSEGRAQVAWKGLSGMDAARAALGRGRHRHGWPVTASPWNVTGAREPRRSRGRMQGQAFLLTFFGAGHPAFEKSESPSRAKPMPQPTRPTGTTQRTQSQKASLGKTQCRFPLLQKASEPLQTAHPVAPARESAARSSSIRAANTGSRASSLLHGLTAALTGTTTLTSQVLPC